jgi:predicted amidophosphoribosyltransferase
MTTKCSKCNRDAVVIEPYGVLCAQCWLQGSRVYQRETSLDKNKPTRYTMKANKPS